MILRDANVGYEEKTHLISNQMSMVIFQNRIELFECNYTQNFIGENRPLANE